MTTINESITNTEEYMAQAISKDLRETAKLLSPKDAALNLPASDIAAAKFLKLLFAQRYSYVPTSKASGDWYYWSGQIHVKDDLSTIDDTMATAYAEGVLEAVRFIRAVGKPDTSKETQKELDGFLKPAEDYAKSLMMERAHTKLRTRIRVVFRVATDHFDQDRQWAVLSDGMVLDLDNLDGELLEPDMCRPVNKTLGVAYSSTEYPAKWVKALNDWVPEKDVQDYLQIAAGAALLGRGDAKNIVTLVGLSHTGKSTYINVLRDVFGGYAGELPATAIVQKYGGASNFEQWKARGKRFLYLSEPQNAKTDDAFLKALSGGGDTISTAKKGQDVVEWHAQCVLHIAANHVPRFDTRDNAIVGRMNIVGFDHVFAPDSDERKGNLVAELVQEEGSQIFMWIVEGARRYMEFGYIPVPDSVKSRAEGNVVESSAPLRWLLERVEDGLYVLEPGGAANTFITPKDGYKDFQEWCFNNGEGNVKQKAWLSEIEAYNSMPQSKKGKRSEGLARVYGVQERRKMAGLNLHSAAGETSAKFRDLLEPPKNAL